MWIRNSHSFKACAAIAGILAVTCSAAFGHTLHVPFFRDDGGAMESNEPLEGSAGFISVSNSTSTTVTLYIVYEQADLNGDIVIQEAQTYPLEGGQGISWRPVKNFQEEGTSISVPGVILGFGDSGAARIIWLDVEAGAGALSGRYTEYTEKTAFAHVLLSE